MVTTATEGGETLSAGSQQTGDVARFAQVRTNPTQDPPTTVPVVGMPNVCSVRILKWRGCVFFVLGVEASVQSLPGHGAAKAAHGGAENCFPACMREVCRGAEAQEAMRWEGGAWGVRGGRRWEGAVEACTELWRHCLFGRQVRQDKIVFHIECSSGAHVEWSAGSERKVWQAAVPTHMEWQEVCHLVC